MLSWRPKFLFPELEIPDPPANEDAAAPVGEFDIELESDEEWESEEDLKFDLDDKDKEIKDGDRDTRLSWMNTSFHSSASVYSCSTISLEEALNDSQEFHADRGDLDFDMGERWKTALRESLNQPIFLDFDRQPRKEAIRKLGKFNRKKKKKAPTRRKSESDLPW